MQLVSIVIVNYNKKEYLVKCLGSIANQTYRDIETVVVDNGSTDGSRQMLKLNYLYLKVIANDRNELYCKAQNQGIRESKGEYIICLNNDVVLEDNFVEEMVKAVSSDRRIGAVNGKIILMDGETIDSTGLILSKARRFFNRGRGEIDYGQYDNNKKIFGSCGACAVYKREMLENIKINGEYIDSDFFVLIEDFDLAWRAKNFGWDARYIPEARCFHRGGFSFKDDQLVQYFSFRNRYFLMFKNDNFISVLRDIFRIIPYDFARLPYSLITNKYALGALKEIKTALPRMLKKRSIIIKNIHKCN